MVEKQYTVRQMKELNQLTLGRDVDLKNRIKKLIESENERDKSFVLAKKMCLL